MTRQVSSSSRDSRVGLVARGSPRRVPRPRSSAAVDRHHARGFVRGFARARAAVRDRRTGFRLGLEEGFFGTSG